MLHNSGPYGPNEAPINLGTPVNMTPMSTPINLVQNLGKNLHQSAQTAGEHYNIPDYSSYSPSLNMPSQMSPFHTYRTDSHESEFLVQNTGLSQNLSWQNGIYATSMNSQASNGSNMLNYPTNYEKEAPNTVNPEMNRQMICTKTLPINIPQVPTIPFQNVNNDSNFSLYNVNKDKFNNYNNSLDLKCEEQPLLDSNKRKSLANTVRLIEDILENTVKNKKLEKLARDREKNEKFENKKVVQSTDDSKQKNDFNEINAYKSDDNSNGLVQQTSESNPDAFIQPEDIIRKTNDTDTDEINLIEFAFKELENTKEFENVQIKLETEEEPSVTVKVEQMNWTNLEFGNPFHRDTTGITREDLGDRVFIDGDNSVEVAKADIDNDIVSNTYYECPHCNLCFDHPKRFLIHYKWHSFGVLHNKHAEISKKKEMKQIQKKHAKDAESVKAEPKKFTCKDCDKVFLTKSSLKNHRLRNHSNYTRECKVCHKEIFGFVAMKSHLASHNRDKEPMFQCPECDKKFRHKHTLAKHRDTHLEKTVACEQCPKMYGSVNQLKMHMKVHERVERGPSHRCSYCSKAFYEAYSLQVHERVHRNERPYVCDICSTGFSTNSSLKRHLKVSHSTLKPFECSHCHRCFVSASIRDGHEARLHADPSQFKFVCQLCDSRHYKLKDLQKHMSKVHPKGKRKKIKNEANVRDSD